MRNTSSWIWIIGLALLFVIGGCRKDTIAEVVSGTYVVSGYSAFDTSAPPITNARVVVTKVADKLNKAQFSGFPHNTEMNIQYFSTNTDTGFLFLGSTGGSVNMFNYALTFYKRDSLQLYYDYQDSIPQRVHETYYLYGRRQ